jgi:hypothetical protein
MKNIFFSSSNGLQTKKWQFVIQIFFASFEKKIWRGIEKTEQPPGFSDEPFYGLKM